MQVFQGPGRVKFVTAGKGGTPTEFALRPEWWGPDTVGVSAAIDACDDSAFCRVVLTGKYAMSEPFVASPNVVPFASGCMRGCGACILSLHSLPKCAPAGKKVCANSWACPSNGLHYEEPSGWCCCSACALSTPAARWNENPTSCAWLCMPCSLVHTSCRPPQVAIRLDPLIGAMPASLHLQIPRLLSHQTAATGRACCSHLAHMAASASCCPGCLILPSGPSRWKVGVHACLATA